MSDRPGGLGPPDYKGPGRPIRTVAPADIKHVKEGRFCGQCGHYVNDGTAKEYLRKTGFWEKVFHNKDDGHDLKPWMVGDPAMYSICDLKECATHFFGSCPRWKSGEKFCKIHLGGDGT